MGAKSTILTSKRITLRQLDISDVGPIAALAGDWDVARMTDRIPYPYSQYDAQIWIESIPESEYVFAIVPNSGEPLIGLCGVLIQAPGTAEIGYWIGKPWWGQGYATEAAGTLIRYGFRTLKLQRITCCHYVDNAASERVINKLKFQVSGRCERWCQARRRAVEAVHYELKRPLLPALWRPAA